jgi:hypothetical protein
MERRRHRDMEGLLVAERAKRLILAAGQVHDRQSTLQALLNVQDNLGLEFIGALTLYRNVKDPKVAAVHIGRTENAVQVIPFALMR